jgi:hypothetical protein
MSNSKRNVSWCSVLLVEETGIPGENTDMPQESSYMYKECCLMQNTTAFRTLVRQFCS